MQCLQAVIIQHLLAHAAVDFGRNPFDPPFSVFRGVGNDSEVVQGQRNAYWVLRRGC